MALVAIISGKNIDAEVNADQYAVEIDFVPRNCVGPRVGSIRLERPFALRHLDACLTLKRAEIRVLHDL